ALLNPKLAPRLPAEERNVALPTVLWSLLTSFAPLAGLIGAALGSIILGLATPSEAAAMGSLGALLLAVGYGADYSKRRDVIIMRMYGTLMGLLVAYLILCAATEYFTTDKRVLMVAALVTIAVGLALLPGTNFKLSQVKDSVFLTVRTTAMVCWLFIGSFTFSPLFAFLGGPRAIQHFLLSPQLGTPGVLCFPHFYIFLLGLALLWV